MRALLIAAILIAGCASAWGQQYYSAQVLGETVNVAGPSTWNYTVINTSASPSYTLWLFAIEVDEGTEVTSISSPKGWACDWSIPHFISWMFVSGELPKGGSQSGFSAELDREPDYQSWTAMFNNIDNPGETPADFGNVANASPEPAGIVALFGGLIALAGLRRAGRT